jgi:sulfur relay (sulfurtransferase) DsrF/TusC family protein
MATVAVLLRSAPFGSRRSAEALRMSVGQTLADNQVRLIFAADAVYILSDVQPDLIEGGEVRRPLETLRMLGHSLLAERESLEERGIERVPEGIRPVSRAEVAEALLHSDVVIVW